MKRKKMRREKKEKLFSLELSWIVMLCGYIFTFRSTQNTKPITNIDDTTKCHVCIVFHDDSWAVKRVNARLEMQTIDISIYTYMHPHWITIFWWNICIVIQIWMNVFFFSEERYKKKIIYKSQCHFCFRNGENRLI